MPRNRLFVVVAVVVVYQSIFVAITLASFEG
jgi:hypothetical protein